MTLHLFSKDTARNPQTSTNTIDLITSICLAGSGTFIHKSMLQDIKEMTANITWFPPVKAEK